MRAYSDRTARKRERSIELLRTPKRRGEFLSKLEPACLIPLHPGEESAEALLAVLRRPEHPANVISASAELDGTTDELARAGLQDSLPHALIDPARQRKSLKDAKIGNYRARQLVPEQARILCQLARFCSRPELTTDKRQLD